jgi:hypothetical protein
MTISNENARGGAGIPKKPVIHDGESTAAIQIRVQKYFNALRVFWQSAGIDIESADAYAQLKRLPEILRAQGNHGLGSLEGRAAGAMVQLPARIFDLKNRGYQILSVPESAYGADGLQHRRTARYFLVAEPNQEAA